MHGIDSGGGSIGGTCNRTDNNDIDRIINRNNAFAENGLQLGRIGRMSALLCYGVFIMIIMIVDLVKTVHFTG